MTRNQAIAAKCRECIHDPLAAGTWREQVAVCVCMDCPLWQFRPMPRHAPPWLASREPGNLPAGFADLAHDAAVALLRTGRKGGRCARTAARRCPR
jgi:hypothetical protein